jgi:single-strand DNA-binding protein
MSSASPAIARRSGGHHPNHSGAGFPLRTQPGHEIHHNSFLNSIERIAMSNEVSITIVGNLVDDPELRYLANGAGVTNFSVASTPRLFDQATRKWRDGEPLFLRCQVWRDQAEHVAESLPKGTRVIVQGRLRQRNYETTEGERRTVMELDVEEIGPALRFATTTVHRASAGKLRIPGTSAYLDISEPGGVTTQAPD